jgi:flavin-dependent dehydrogenase
LDRFDVAIVGGGLTGSAAALLLRRRLPQARVLMLEARADFSPRVLPTAELSSLFLTRGLRLWDHLARRQLPHYGPRFFFHNDDVLRIQDATELGARVQPSGPAFLLREDVLCAQLHREALGEGCTVLRPATLRSLELRPFDTVLRWSAGGGSSGEGGEGGGRGGEAACTWLLDASGRAAVLGRHLGLLLDVAEHPVASISARWHGDLDVDGPRFDPETEFGRGTLVARRLCSNHFQGYGYRVSFLALGEGEMSVSISYDRRVLDLHEQEDPADAYTAFLSGLPATRQLLQSAEMQRESLVVTPQVAYRARQRTGPGWALMGSAAGSLDPACVPETDLVAHTVESTLDLVREHIEGRPVAAAIERQNGDWTRSYTRAMAARCRDRYLVHGDFDLFWPTFLLDQGLYMLGEVLPAVRRYQPAIARLPMASGLGAMLGRLMAFYSRRFVRMARTRMWTGNYGRANVGQRLSFHLGLGGWAAVSLLHGLAGWLLRELEHVGLDWARWLRRRLLGQERPLGDDLSTLPEGVEILADAEVPQ